MSPRPAGLAKLAAFSVRHRQHAGRARQHASAGDGVEGELGQAAALDPRGCAVRCKYVRDAGGPQMTRCDHAGEVPAGVQVRDIKGSGVFRHISVEAQRDEKLQVIRQAVRPVWKDADVDAVGRGFRPGLKSGGGQSRAVVARVGRADGDGMSAPRESARERVREPRDAAVRPRVLEVGRDVQDSE